MKFSRTLYTLAAVLIVAVLVAGGVSFLIPQKALAAGETYTWSGSNIIVTGGRFDGPFLTPKPLVLKKGADGKYTGTQTLTTKAPCTSKYTLTYNASGSTISAPAGGIGCPNPYSATVPTIRGTAPADAGTTSNDPADLPPEDQLCDTVAAGDLGFIVCPAINTVVEGAKKLDETVLCILTLDTFSLFADGQQTGGACPENASSTSSAAYYSAWLVFRNIAYALLVGFGLIMVASQIIGLELFDAYTIKKMLPKLVIATILIAISWQLMDFLYNLSNDSAYAIMDLIKAPFKDMKVEDLNTSGGVTIAALMGALFLGGGAVLGYLILAGWGAFFALILIVLLAVFSGFVLLEARNVVADMLAIASPVALMCYAFEPFKKLFTVWKTLLITVTISVPSIAGVIALSHVGALVSYASGGFVGAASAFIILIAGYALVWGIFKKLDAVAGQLGDIASKATGRINKGLSTYRSNQAKRGGQMLKQGALLSENNAFGRTFNALGRRVGAANATGRFRGGALLSTAAGRKSRSYYDSILRDESAKTPMMGAIANDDDANAVLALSGGVGTKESLEAAAARLGMTGERAERAIGGAKAVGVNRQTAMTALRTSMQNKARAFGAGRVDAVDYGVRRLARNQDEYDGLAYDVAFNARSGGRADLGGTDWIDYKQDGDAWKQARAAAPNNAQGQWQVISDRTMLDGVGRMTAPALLAGHTNQTTQTMQTLSRILQQSPDVEARTRAAIALKEIHGSLPAGASGESREAVNRVLYSSPEQGGLGINPNGNVADQLAQRLGREGVTGQTLTTMGRTYGEYNAEDAARRQQAGESP